MADQKLVSLSQEIALCESHLKIMGYRKGLEFVLVTEINREAKIPPAIFHTLVENAITHNHYRTGSIHFKLFQEVSLTTVRYIFTVPIVDAKLNFNSRTGCDQGTGLRYIKARLEESYANQWKLEEQELPGEWKTLISIPVCNNK